MRNIWFRSLKRGSFGVWKPSFYVIRVVSLSYGFYSILLLNLLNFLIHNTALRSVSIWSSAVYLVQLKYWTLPHRSYHLWQHHNKLNGTFLQEINYEQRGQSETIRLSKNAKILGFASHPITERNFSVLASDGRLIFVDVIAAVNDACDAWKATTRRLTGDKVCRPPYCLEDLLPSRFVKRANNFFTASAAVLRCCSATVLQCCITAVICK